MMHGSDQNLRKLTGYQIRRTSSEVLYAVNKVLQPFGLRRTTFSVLFLIVEQPGLRQSHLSQGLNIERPNLVQLLSVLEKAGLIERERTPEDGRAYALRATEAGRLTLQRAVEAVEAFEAKMLHGLSDEETAIFRNALQHIECNARNVEVTNATPV